MTCITFAYTMSFSHAMDRLFCSCPCSECHTSNRRASDTRWHLKQRLASNRKKDKHPRPHVCCLADVVIDGSLARDGSGRPLTKLVWMQAGTDFILQAAIDQANSQNGGNGSPRLVIPGAQVGNTKFATAEHSVTLTATNYLGVSGEASFTFEKVESGRTPIVSVVGGTSQSFTIAQGLRIATQLVATSVCADSKVSGARVLTMFGSKYSLLAGGDTCAQIPLDRVFCNNSSTNAFSCMPYSCLHSSIRSY